MLVCVRECTPGSEWIGTSFIQWAHNSCQCAATSVLESPSNFDFIFDKEDKMKAAKSAMLLLFLSPLVPHSQAEIRHIEMRVEGMT